MGTTTKETGHYLHSKIKGAGAGILGGLGCFAAIIIPAVLFLGAAWVSNKILPWFFFVTALSICFVLFILLPLSLIRACRGFVSITAFCVSYVFGATLWMWSLLLTISLWGIGWAAAGLMLAGLGILPMAFLATGFKGMWGVFFQLSFLALLTYGLRVFAVWLSTTTNAENHTERYEVVDSVEESGNATPPTEDQSSDEVSKPEQSLRLEANGGSPLQPISAAEWWDGYAKIAEERKSSIHPLLKCHPPDSTPEQRAEQPTASTSEPMPQGRTADVAPSTQEVKPSNPQETPDPLPTGGDWQDASSLQNYTAGLRLPDGRLVTLQQLLVENPNLDSVIIGGKVIPLNQKHDAR